MTIEVPAAVRRGTGGNCEISIASPVSSMRNSIMNVSARLVALFLCLVVCAPVTWAFTPPPVAAENGMVVSSQRLASEAGIGILEAGGNAVDAAVAVGYVLAVVNPCCGNLGGGGFATLKLADGRAIFVNFREKAPLAATSNMYLDDKGEVVADASLKGYLAVAVPGSVLGLDTMLQNTER